MTNRQLNGSQNFTPQSSFIIAPQQQMISANLKQQPLIATMNPQVPQFQPVYIISGGSSMPIMNPMMYQYNPMIPFTSPSMQFMYYLPTYRQNPISSRQLTTSNSLPPEPLKRIEKKTEQPIVPQRQKSKEVTMLYRYQKPVTVDELKHPSDKYKDLIYRPKYITSKNIDPPTDELIPKLDENSMTPLVGIKSRLNLTPSSDRRPILVENLKLPLEKLESDKKSVTKLPTLVEDLKMPVAKTPEPKIKKPEVKSELIQVPDPDLFKFIESGKNSLNYIGKFHYPPEVDFNDVAEIRNEFTDEKAEKMAEFRPKSVFVKVSLEKDSFELAKILFNPNVIIEFNQLIEAKKLDNETTLRPKSSKVKEKEERSPILSKALKNVQEINESFKMEQSSLNENLRVPSRQSVKIVEHNDRTTVNKRALSNAVEVNEILQDQQAKFNADFKMQETEKAVVKEENFIKVKNRVKFNGIEYVENFKLTEVKPEPVLVREKSITLLTRMTDKLNVYNRVLFISKEIYENIKFENLSTHIDYTDIEKLKLKVKYKITDSNETDKYLVQHVLFNAYQICHDGELNQQIKDIVLEKPLSSKLRAEDYKPTRSANNRVLSNALQLNEKLNIFELENVLSLNRDKSLIAEITDQKDNKQAKNRAYSNAFQIMEILENNVTEEESGLIREKSLIIKPSAENNIDPKDRATFISNEVIEHHFAEYAENNEIAREKSILADERIHSANVSKNLAEKVFYKSHQMMEDVKTEDLVEQTTDRPKSEKVEIELQNENFVDQSQEKFVTDIPVRNDIEEDDASDEVNIEQYESNIKNQTEKKHHEHHFHFHGGNRICCSAHRRHDPYYHIESKVKSFENFGYQPQHHNFQIFSDRTYSRKNKPRIKSRKNLIHYKPNQLALPSIKNKNAQLLEYDGYKNVVKLPDGSIRIFSENLQWNHVSKIGHISFENFKYKNEKNQVEIFNQKLKWRAESKISKLSNENIRYRQSKKRAVVFSEKLKWNKESKIGNLSELDMSHLNTHRSSQILVFHDLPKWNELVDSKVKSFENFHYKPSESSLRIYNEKIRWNSESRLKSYLNSSHDHGSQTKLDSNRDVLFSQYRPEWFPGAKKETFNVYYKKWPSEPHVKENTFRPIINENPNWNVESRIKAISWENIKYRPKITKKKEKFKSIPEKKNSNLTHNVASTNKQKNVSQIWNQEYNRIKQENKQKRNLQLKNIKTPRKNKMETPEITKISSRQSMSKYKELPPIKSGKENNFSKLSNLENTAFYRDETPEDKPSWNLISSSQRSFSRMFNQELNDQSQKRFKYDAELKRKSNDQINNSSQMTQNDDFQRKNNSQFGTELINDLRLPKIKSPNRKSTPDTFRLSSIQAPSVMNTTFDKESIIQERKITKRTKKPKENKKESRLSKQFEPQVDGFQLHGSTLKIEGDAKVRPLANMNYKNAEEKVKIRATSRLYSSLMTPRSYFSNDTSMNF